MFDTSPQDEMADSCRRDDVTRVRELLAYGLSPKGSRDGLSFLSIAVTHGAEAVVRLLLQEGADAVANDLGRAMRSGCVPVAAMVLDDLHKRRVDYDFWSDERPLLTDPVFLREISVEMVEWMMAAGCDPTERDRHGQDGIAVAQKLASQGEISPRIVSLLTARRKRGS